MLDQWEEAAKIDEARYRRYEKLSLAVGGVSGVVTIGAALADKPVLATLFSIAGATGFMFSIGFHGKVKETAEVHYVPTDKAREELAARHEELEVDQAPT